MGVQSRVVLWGVSIAEKGASSFPPGKQIRIYDTTLRHIPEDRNPSSQQKQGHEISHTYYNGSKSVLFYTRWRNRKKKKN